MKKLINYFKTPEFIITAVSLAVYGWSISFGFLYYDDHLNVFENQPLLGGQILYFWQHAHEGLYVPLVYTVWSVLYKMFGLNPAAFHGLNVLLHILNAVLVYKIITRFKISEKAALVGSLLFAVHPIQVESVAWITSLKDVSFSFFSLLAIWIYLFSAVEKNWRWLLGLVAVSAAILCKPTAAVLPLLICGFVFFGARGNFKERLQETLKTAGPLPLTLLLGYYSIAMAKTGQAWLQDPKAAVTFFEKPLVALDAVGFYTGKLFIPSNFYVDYARFPRNVLDNGMYYLNVGLALILIFGVVYWLWKGDDDERRKARLFAVLLGALFFLPTSGLIAFGHQRISTTADRYMYFVMVAVAVIAAIFFEKWGKKQPKIGLIAGVVIAILGALSFMQSINWKDITLFTENLYEGNPNNYFANRNIGLLYQMKGDDKKAMEFFKKAHEINPNHLSALAGITSLYFNNHEYEKMDEFVEQNLTEEKLRRLEQTSYETHAFYLAVAESYIDRKNYDKAMEYLCKARNLGIAQLAQELYAKIESVKKSGGNPNLKCSN